MKNIFSVFFVILLCALLSLAPAMAEGGVIHRGIDHAFIMNQFQHEEKSEGVAGLMRRVKELRASKEAEKK